MVALETSGAELGCCLGDSSGIRARFRPLPRRGPATRRFRGRQPAAGHGWQKASKRQRKEDSVEEIGLPERARPKMLGVETEEEMGTQR